MPDNAVTQKHLGVIPSTWGEHEGKFRELRHLAHSEYIERKQKVKRNKKEKVPKYHPGQIVVVCREASGNNRQYALCEIIDFEQDNIGSDFEYYAIILKTTEHKMISRVGRLIKIQATWFHREKIISEYKEEDCKIKWIESQENLS